MHLHGHSFSRAILSNRPVWFWYEVPSMSPCCSMTSHNGPGHCWETEEAIFMAWHMSVAQVWSAVAFGKTGYLREIGQSFGLRSRVACFGYWRRKAVTGFVCSKLQPISNSRNLKPNLSECSKMLFTRNFDPAGGGKMISRPQLKLARSSSQQPKTSPVVRPNHRDQFASLIGLVS